VRSATPKLDAGALIDGVANAVAAIEASVGRPAAAVGIGLPGLVDTAGTLAMGPHLPGIRRQRFKPAFEERLGLPVHVDNDATCAVWAEHVLGAGRGASDVVMITLGTGIGSGIVAGGRVVRGANGFAGEPGHTVVDPNGPACPCGRRGCWERFASGSGLGRLARDAAEAGRAPGLIDAAGGDVSHVRGEHVTAAAGAGDPGAVEVLWDFAWWVALGIANLVNVLDPEIVVIGGGLAEMGDLLLQPVNERYQDLVMAGEHRPVVPIVAALLGEHAGAVGAALLALE
jgi:glucokinase